MNEHAPPSTRKLPPFAPAQWLHGGHRQTLAGAYLYNGPLRAEGERHIVSLPDGDKLLVLDAAPAEWRPGDRIAMLFHGLGGSHRSPYVLRVSSKLRQRGVRTVCVNMRGYGEGIGLAQGPGHAGRSEDAAAVAAFVNQRHPASPITILGFSLGGNIVLKLAGELGDLSHLNIDSCWSAGPPMDVSRCAENMRLPSRKIYSRSFVRALWKQIHQSRKLHESLQNLELGRKPKHVDEFDDRFTAPLSGFRDAAEYYAAASSMPNLWNICIPTQIIAADDDPIIPIEIFREAKVSPTTELHIARSGGHLGFVAKQGVDPDRRWLDWRAVDWVMLQGIQRRSASGRP